MSRLATAWCRAYTTMVPADPRARRREEIESFVWEARSAGLSGLRIVIGAIKGAFDDLRWCRAERARANLVPVSATPAGSTAIAGGLIGLTYVGRAFFDDAAALRGSSIAAVVVLIVGYVTRFRARRDA